MATHPQISDSAKAQISQWIAEMTLEEKASQLNHKAPSIPRLGIPAYSWSNECLHGVAHAGLATVFPQPIGMAATMSPQRIFEVATVISDEARAKHHEALRHNDHGPFKGLNFWAPNVNIYRDPRWGRGHETFGEDPFLTSEMGVAFVQGLQGDDPRYLKTIATPKHYAVHSGPEELRHEFNAVANDKDLWETYLPAFRACVMKGQAASIMGAYNRLNGDPCCANPYLLNAVLREAWGFDGFVVSDCGAIDDFHLHHQVTNNAEQSAALALKEGCDLCCGQTYESLVEAVQQGLIEEEVLDRSLYRLFEARWRLGMFSPPDEVSYAPIPYEIVACPEHRQLARDVGAESIVLLKNVGILPLSAVTTRIAVIGPNANEAEVLLGNYHGMPSHVTTILDGIRRQLRHGQTVWYARGCQRTAKGGYNTVDESDRAGFWEARAAAERSDVIVAVLGLSVALEGEQGDAFNAEASGDRTHLTLPRVQQELLEMLHAMNKPIVLVLVNGGPLDLRWADENVSAIVEAWYPGAEGGEAVAEVLFGAHNPAGRLPVTFVRSVEDLPPFSDYRMIGRTYRYLETDPLYPFGYGLSYSRFHYSQLTLQSPKIAIGSPLDLSVTVSNLGPTAGHEVTQVYLQRLNPTKVGPHWNLVGIQRTYLEPGRTAELRFRIEADAMGITREDGTLHIEPGTYRLHVSGHQPDKRSLQLTGQEVLFQDITLG